MDRTKEARRAMLIPALLAILTLATFWPVFRSGFLRYDDPLYVTDNPHVLTGLTWENVSWAFRSGWAGNWHPLTWLSHMLDVDLFGANPAWHHAINLLIHMANALLLFGLFRRMTGRVWRSATVAALFALHPLHVESVAWIAERKDVLSAFFFILTVWAYYESKVQGPKSKVGDGGDGSRWGRGPFYVLALGLFALGLMCKPMLVTVPFVLLLLDFWPLGRFRGTAEAPAAYAADATGGPAPVSFTRLLLEKVPFFALSLASSAVTFLVQDRSHAVSLYLPFGRRVANAVASYIKYLEHTVWPADLAVFYPHPDLLYPASSQWPLWQILAGGLLLLGLSVAAVLRWKRQPWLATGWFWFLGMLVPVIGLVQVGSQAMADRYTYLPLIGIFVCLVWSAAEWLSPQPFGRRVLAAAAVLAVGACAVVAHVQARSWRDSLSVFERALAVTRNNALAHCYVGAEYGEKGQYDLAISHFRAAAAAVPSFADAYRGLGFTSELMRKPAEAVEQYQAALRLRPWDEWVHNRLGLLLSALGKKEEAVAEFQEALRCRPDYVEAHYNLGAALFERNDFNAAIPHFIEAARLKPDHTEALNRLAEALLKIGRTAEAQAVFRDLTRVAPTDPDARINLGGVLWMRGQRELALQEYAEAVRLRPGYPVAQYNLGATLLALNQPAEAANHFAAAVRLKPDYPAALTGLGRALAAQGKMDEAIGRFQESLRQQPDAWTCFNLGMAQALQGRPAAAITNYQSALQLRPDWPPALNELAWLRATHPDSALRDGAEAVRLAERACQLTDGKDPRLLATLDAAYAECGRFDEAIATAEKARSLAWAANQRSIALAAESRLTLYRKQQPFRQP